MKIRFKYSIILFFMGFLLYRDHTTLCSIIICATTHELGHLICAKILKIRIGEIVIDIGGAKIHPKSSSYPYSDELLLSLSGPFSNLICAFMLKLCFIDALYIQTIHQSIIGRNPTFVQSIYIFSLTQAALNLIPINSLDGGRILKCTLSILFSQRIGDITVKISTLMFAILMWITSVYFLLGNGGGISLFVFSICMLFKIFDN